MAPRIGGRFDPPNGGMDFFIGIDIGERVVVSNMIRELGQQAPAKCFTGYSCPIGYIKDLEFFHRPE
jgi:hypothetical protein